MIEVQGLTRRYGDFTAVEDVSFSVGSGQIVGMLGPNGAGKTTTIRMITGFLPPTAGRVSLAGIDLEQLVTRFGPLPAPGTPSSSNRSSNAGIPSSIPVHPWRKGGQSGSTSAVSRTSGRRASGERIMFASYIGAP